MSARNVLKQTKLYFIHHRVQVCNVKDFKPLFSHFDNCRLTSICYAILLSKTSLYKIVFSLSSSTACGR
jgi:hypothetical protein